MDWKINSFKTLSAFVASLLFLFTCEDLFAQNRAANQANKTNSILLTIEGKVEVARAGTLVWTVAQTNQVLQVGDRVRTGPNSRATIRLSNLTVLRVNDLTTLEIRPPQGDNKRTLLDLKSGSTYFFNREKPTEMQFRTPLASGAIRGTEFNLAVADDGRTVLTLLEGEVLLSNAQGDLDLKSGDQGIVEAGKAPTKTPVLDAINIIQWSLYYPGVLDADEAGLTAAERQALRESLLAYQSGDLLQALNSYPDGRQPGSDGEKIYRAALVLAVGQVTQTEAILNSLQVPSPLGQALRKVIAAVKNQPLALQAEPASATEWLAESYYLQSRSELEAALKAARAATEESPGFGFAWVRTAELEFSFGHIAKAMAALARGLAISPRNAEALALKGFLLAAQNRTRSALDYFDQAIAVDGALGNAWLGRGLCRIRLGKAEAGREDLQVAAVLEPQRAVLRSYLAKAFIRTRDNQRAEKELGLALRLDANDPTAWLYSALLYQRENRINEAVTDLEKSKELNENRSVYRSKLLLDQDRAVRSANLAAIYRDVGMTEVSAREASRAVNDDYGNYSAHLFLANSYSALRDPKLVNLRYETPWYSELLVANLLAPAGAGSLSQNISQQEYSRFFEGNHLGLVSGTEYLSSGDWLQYGSQYGILGDSSYALDAYYRTENGQRVNNDLRQLSLSAKFKQQITPSDSLFFQVSGYDAEAGDVTQYYNQAGSLPGVPGPSPTMRVTERQEPNALAGYHHEWSPGVHTLFLAGRFEDTFTLTDPGATLIFIRPSGNVELDTFEVDRRNELVAYSTELQQIWQTTAHTLIIGGRYQTGTSDTTNHVFDAVNPGLGRADIVESFRTHLERLNFYAYHQWQVFEPLRLTAGVSYDRLRFPRNIDTSPIVGETTTTDQVSPKAGLLWTPWRNAHVRAAYTRSLGGVFFDNSIRLEPSQIAGFTQAYRSIAPESAVGLAPGARFETWSIGFDQVLKKTYLGVEGEILNSKGTRSVGALSTAGGLFIPVPNAGTNTHQSLDYQEKSLLFTANQLLGDEWSVGASYRVSEADFTGLFTDVRPNANGAFRINQDVTAILHQVNLYGNFNHPSGLFAQAGSVWTQQSNRGYFADIPGDDFWQVNAFIGYRFLQRQAELKLGLLNINDQDYRLNPLNLYNELPRQRTLLVSFKFYF